MNIEPFFVPYESHRLLPGQRVLVLAPHPDDEVFGCGATLAQLVAAGATVQVVVLTSGLQAELRRQESGNAARVLGYPEPEFLGWPDGGLLADDSVAAQALSAQRLAQLQGITAEFAPDLIVAPSLWEMHRDHRAVAQWALSLLQETQDQLEPPNANCRLAFYEVGVPLAPNYLVDITATKSLKEQAMACFASQLSQQAYADQIRGLNCFRSYTLGLKVTAAEAFYLLKASDTPGFAVNVAPERLSLALINAERRVAEAEAKTVQAEQAQIASQRQLHLMLGSFSWRVTSPLRRLKAWAIRFLGG